MVSCSKSQLARAAPRFIHAETHWIWLFRVGGWAALVSVVFIPIAVAVYATSPPPSTVQDWFALFQSNKLVGLLDLDLLMLAGYILYVPTLLALYVALRRTSESFMAIGLALGLIAAAVYLTSNPSFSMLLLSEQYAGATSEAQRSQLLAAGQTMLAMWQGTAYDVGYVLSGIAGLIVALVMLRGNVFSKTTAFLGVATNALALVPPTIGGIGIVLALLSLIPLIGWDVLIWRRLLELGEPDTKSRRLMPSAATYTPPHPAEKRRS
jgi:hypothetical protein